VFPNGPSAFHATFPGTVGQVEDFGVSTFTNTSKQPVWLTSVEPTSLPRYAHVDSIVAYQYNQAGGGEITDVGDLSKKYPGRFVPHPVTDVEVIPNHIPVWFVVVSMTWTRPVAHFALPPLIVRFHNAAGAQGQEDLPWPITGFIKS
jgi:hypothetical protein